ncbi:putative bifunctional diguanylate cyclase/phosphodiesterase [Mesobacterium pallidum]|uniref:putative bifunctional diguanylate cyclase/phosphodiesterase n=1 Tax=Mesobacterium pallidum TaxID=2872037 RepID=UPI001EE2BC58|nr:bifunctional diguanylate cyclase/phosphodiesterase [Mesobacterium pallidum]
MIRIDRVLSAGIDPILQGLADTIAVGLGFEHTLACFRPSELPTAAYAASTGTSEAMTLRMLAFVNAEMSMNRERQDRGTDDSERLEFWPPRSCFHDGRTMQLLGASLRDDTGRVLGGFSGLAEPGKRFDATTVELRRQLGWLATQLFTAHRQRISVELDLVQANRDKTELRELVARDALTGLVNGKVFAERAEQWLRSTDTPSLFYLLDIDRFREVNALFGHRFGDTYLVTVARALSDAAGEGALVGRIGGDEFAVICPLKQVTSDAVDRMLGSVTNAILRRAAGLGHPELGRVSIGADVVPGRVQGFSEVFDKADSALYAAKEQGRGRHCLFDARRNRRFSDREISRRFIADSDEGRVVPYFQPVFDLATGRCTGLEVLARWLDPEKGALSPDAFNAVFDDRDLAEVLTRNMVSQSLEAYADLLAREGGAGCRPILALNLTTFDLLKREFVFDLQTELARVAVPWSSLVIEVTERVVMGEKSGQVFRNLSEMRRRGARIALDDFGTGHGGLRHLSDWPLDVLKIDRSFVRALAEHAGSRDRVVFDAILLMARKFGFGVVAEGVETAAQLAALREIGCPHGQGYLLGAPVAAEDLDTVCTPRDLQALSAPAPARGAR